MCVCALRVLCVLLGPAFSGGENTPDGVLTVLCHIIPFLPKICDVLHRGQIICHNVSFASSILDLELKPFKEEVPVG